MAKKRVYKITFINQGKVYEVYASNIGGSGMLGFIEVSGLLFGERSSLVLDPAEESLKSEFRDVKTTYIPMHSVIRIDEVEKQGQAKITEIKTEAGSVMPFPIPVPAPSKGSDSS
ncbi:MAG: DUF1820 family protein [Mariprofundaceae bacterium]